MDDPTHPIFLTLFEYCKATSYLILGTEVPLTTLLLLLTGQKTSGTCPDGYPGQTSGQQLDLNELSRITNFYLCNKFQIKYN
jgi:hypothetical protein